jgi:hypothetical protein
LDLAKNSRTSQQVKGTGKKAIFAVPTFFVYWCDSTLRVHYKYSEKISLL